MLGIGGFGSFEEGGWKGFVEYRRNWVEGWLFGGLEVYTDTPPQAFRAEESWVVPFAEGTYN